MEYDVVGVGSDDEVNLGENEDMKACQVYKSQIHRGRYLLHKHPWSASLWQKESKKMMLMQQISAREFDSDVVETLRQKEVEWLRRDIHRVVGHRERWSSCGKEKYSNLLHLYYTKLTMPPKRIV